MRLLSCAEFFLKINFIEKQIRNAIRASTSLSPDQDRPPVGPDLGPNYLQRLSSDDKSRFHFESVILYNLNTKLQTLMTRCRLCVYRSLSVMFAYIPLDVRPFARSSVLANGMFFIQNTLT